MNKLSEQKNSSIKIELDYEQRLITIMEQFENQVSITKKLKGQLEIQKDLLKNLQVEYNSLEINVNLLKQKVNHANSDQEMWAEKYNDAVSEFEKFKHEHDFAQGDIATMRKHHQQLRDMHREEINIYKDKTIALKHQLEQELMPMEDLRTQYIRQQDKFQKFKLMNKQMEMELKFLSRKYIAFLISKSWAATQKEVFEQ